jgi:putative heme-binding domain-containing protein
VKGIFERFLPPEQRRQTLGANIDPRRILSLMGRAEEGRRLFAQAEGVSCRNCHQAEGVGREVGPGLAGIGVRRSREFLLQSILEPSREIEGRFTSYVVETKEGRIHSGLLADRTEEALTLREGSGAEIEIDLELIESVLPQPRSLMPEGLVQEFTAQELADLVEYLGSLKTPAE